MVNELAEIASEMRARLEDADVALAERRRCKRWLSVLERLSAPAAPPNLLDVSDLPAELVKELNLPSDQLETQILGVLRTLGQPADLDQILIGLYRQFEVIQKRRFLQNKLWRMVKKQQIHKAKKHKGHYALDAAKVRDDKPARRRA